MKVVLYMAISVNGYIAKVNNDTPWSEEEFQSYSKFVKEFKNLVIGRATYEVMRANDEFRALGRPFIVVVSSKPVMHDSNVVAVTTPEEALKILAEKNFDKALVAGGGVLNASFMQKRLISEIYLDVEPLVFGRGVRLFAGQEFEASLEFLGVVNLSQNSIQLHYSVRNVGA